MMYENKGAGCKYSGNSVLAVNKPNTVNPRISGCYLSILISVERFTDITVSLYFHFISLPQYMWLDVNVSVCPFL